MACLRKAYWRTKYVHNERNFWWGHGVVALVICCLFPSPVLPEITKPSVYVIESDTFPDDVRFRPPIGNGHLATNVLSDTVYMNGLYNGLEDKSSRARIPGYIAVDVDVTGQQNITRKYTLDMYRGLFIQHIHTSLLDIRITYLAHRKFTRLLVTLLDIRRMGGVPGPNITVTLRSNQVNDSNDFTTQTHEKDHDHMYYHGTVKEMEIFGTERSALHVAYTPVPREFVLTDDNLEMTTTFLASHSQTREDATHAFISGQIHERSLLESHTQAWKALWEEGRIDIHGNEDLAQDIAAATYNILCSVPSQDDPLFPFFGLSPGGLSRGGLLVPTMPGGGHNDYAGHVFWDMDTWMMPPIMILHPDMASRMLRARTRVLEQIRKNAELEGYKGAKFPWEQAATGIEATPKWAGNMSRYEIHISADVSYALRQYLYATGDSDLFLNGRGLELALEIARFWQSRVKEDTSGTVDILGVMGPDEYHFNIDNSVYTNYNAKLSLLLPGDIIDALHTAINDSILAELDTWKKTAARMLILFDQKLQYHPQYQGFNRSVEIKQSDVVLLGYPLMMPMSPKIRENDLSMYEEITNPQGPDTGTWSMHTVGWLELGNQARSYKNFKMMLRNINEPFKVFSEKPVTNTSNGGCVNFITAAGGLLQSIIFGYGGVRLHPDQLIIQLTVLPNTTSWGISGIHYKGLVLNVHIEKDDVTVNVISKPEAIYAVLVMNNVPQTVHESQEFRIKRQSISLRVSNTGETMSTFTQQPVTTTPTFITTQKPVETTSAANFFVVWRTFLFFIASVVLLVIN